MHRLHSYAHDEGQAFGLEAAEKLDLDPLAVFKTLLVQSADADFAVAVIPVSKQLNLKLVAKALGTKSVAMALANDAQRVTGYVIGGISPIGQKKSLMTLIDQSAETLPTIYVSGGRRGLEIELSPQNLLHITSARFAAITD